MNKQIFHSYLKKDVKPMGFLIGTAWHMPLLCSRKHGSQGSRRMEETK